MPSPGFTNKGMSMPEVGNFGRCNKCMALNWDSPIYMRTYGLTGCRKCGANETRWQGKISLFERLYLLRWYLWEAHMFNRKFEEGDPDPNWWMNPMNVLRTIWRGLHPDLGFVDPSQQAEEQTDEERRDGHIIVEEPS